MVKIPEAEPNVGLNPVNTTKASGQAAAQMAQTAAGFNQELENTAQLIDKVRDVQQVNAASILANERLNDIKFRAASDPDIYGQQKYVDEMQKLGSEAAKTITSPAARQQFQMSYDTAAVAAQHSIRVDFRDRQLKAAQADMLTNVEVLKNAYCGSAFPHEKETTAALIKKTIENNRDAGVLDAVEATKMWQVIQKELPERDAKLAISQDPKTALLRLQNNAFPIADESKKADLIKEAENAIIRHGRQAIKDLEVKHEQTNHDLMVDLLKGSLTPDRVREEHEANNIADKDAEHLMNALNSTKLAELKVLNEKQKEEHDQKHAEKYLELWDVVLSKGKAAAKRERLLKEFAAGNLTRKDLERLYTGAIIPQPTGGKVSLSDIVYTEGLPRANWLDQAWRTIQSWFPKTEEESTAGEDSE